MTLIYNRLKTQQQVKMFSLMQITTVVLLLDVPVTVFIYLYYSCSFSDSMISIMVQHEYHT